MDISSIKDVDPIALWGAILSTLLAARELLKARMKLEVGFTFTGDVDGIGNKIFVRNLSGRPAIITYYQVQVCKRKRTGWELIDSVAEADEYFNDISIAPHASITFKFSGPEYFSTNPRDHKGDAIFLYLLVSGKRRPVKLKMHEINS